MWIFMGWKNGKIKQYNCDGRLQFEGYALNGKINGKGKEYDDFRNIIFEGEYLYNYRLKGKQYVRKRLEFEGEYYFNKKYNGKGYDQDGNIDYEIINGTGTVKNYLVTGEIASEEEYLNGKKNGKYKKYYKGRTIFKGEYVNGKENGHFRILNNYGGLIFEGEYLNRKRWKGKGKEDYTG